MKQNKTKNYINNLEQKYRCYLFFLNDQLSPFADSFNNLFLVAY